MNDIYLVQKKCYGTAPYSFSTYIYDTKGLGEKLHTTAHYHGGWEFVMPTEGNIEVQICAKCHTITPHQGAFIRPQTMHAVRNASRDCRLKAIVFDDDFLCIDRVLPLQTQCIDAFLNSTAKIPCFLVNDSSIEKDILACIHKIMDLCGNINSGTGLKIRANILLLISEIITKYSPQESYIIKHKRNIQIIKKALRYIHENYQHKISLDEICQYVSMSKCYFCRFFKKEMHITIVEYIQRYRIKMASNLLKKNHGKVLEVAIDCGFNNISHFNNVFKQIMACSPSEYRRRYL